MGLRHITAFLGAVLMAGAIAFVAFLAAAVEPEEARAATKVKTCGGRSIALSPRGKRILVLHNKARTDRGLKRLCVDLRLTRAARSHSGEMIEKDYFSHASYDGESSGTRIGRFGYDCGICGENIAKGTGKLGKPRPIFERWMDNADHRGNILNDAFWRVGVGIHTGNYKSTEGYTMYTVDFGGQR